VQIFEIDLPAGRAATAEEIAEYERLAARVAPGANTVVPAAVDSVFTPTGTDEALLSNAVVRFSHGAGWIEERPSGRILANLPPGVVRIALHPHEIILAVCTPAVFHLSLLEPDRSWYAASPMESDPC
jgi:hypothetical protein